MKNGDMKMPTFTRVIDEFNKKKALQSTDGQFLKKNNRDLGTI